MEVNMYDYIQRKIGGQPANQNARKHGFYSKVLSSDEKRELKYASGIDGLDEEIAIMRVKFRRLLQEDGNQALLNQTVESIARLCNIAFNRGSGKNNPAALKDAVASVLDGYLERHLDRLTKVPDASSSPQTPQDSPPADRHCERP
jgi:hypothetical protein